MTGKQEQGEEGGGAHGRNLRVRTEKARGNMKLIVKRAPFAAAWSFAASVAPARSVRPILQNAMLTGDAGLALEVHASDMEIGLRYGLQAESLADPAPLCLPCATLAGLLGECGDEVVSLEADGSHAKVTAGRDTFALVGAAAADFPEVPALTEGETVRLPAGDLRRAIDRTVFAAAREQGRYAINGLYLQAKENKLEVVATDGRRMAWCRAGAAVGKAGVDGIIVPVRAAQLVRKLCEALGDNAEIEFGVRGRNIVFRGGAVTLSSVLVEGVFPKYQQVIPKDCNVEIKIEREALLEGLRKANYLTSDATRAVALTFDGGACLIEAASPDKGQAAVTIEAGGVTNKFAISFNPLFIVECLKALTAETVRLEVNSPDRPGMLREGTEYIYVLMPVTQKE